MNESFGSKDRSLSSVKASGGKLVVSRRDCTCADRAGLCGRRSRSLESPAQGESRGASCAVPSATPRTGAAPGVLGHGSDPSPGD